MFTKNQMKIVPMIAAGAVATLASTASADVLTFGFTDMSGDFVVAPGGGPGGTFAARAVDTPLLRTAGDVSRIVDPFGTAVYDDGFVSGLDPADVSFSLSVFNVVGGPIPTADGLGSFSIVDVDGDTIAGSIDGLWLQLADGIYFNGNLTGVSITSDDGSFDGPAGGSVQTSDLGILEGLNFVLFTNPNGAGFFDTTFRDISTQFSGELIPTPGALALLGLGGLVATRRRR